MARLGTRPDDSALSRVDGLVDFGRELEGPIARSARRDHVSEVALGIEVVEHTARDEGVEAGGRGWQGLAMAGP